MTTKAALLGLNAVSVNPNDAPIVDETVDTVAKNNMLIKKLQAENEFHKSMLKAKAVARGIEAVASGTAPEAIEVIGKKSRGKLIISRSRSKLPPRVTQILDSIEVPYADTTKIVLNPRLTEKELVRIREMMEKEGIQIFEIEKGHHMVSKETVEAFNRKASKQVAEQIWGSIYTVSFKCGESS